MKAIRSSKHPIIARPRTRTLAAVGAAAAGLAAGLVMSAPSASAASYYSTPAIAVAGGNSVIAVQTSGDTLRFYRNKYGTTTWRGELVAATKTTFSAPSIAADGNTVIIAAQGVNHSLQFYLQQIGATGWHAETVAGARTTYSAPSLTVNGGGVNIVAQGPANSLDFYWALNGTQTWHLEGVAGAGTTYSAPAITGSGGSANVVAEGPGNSLDFYWQRNGARAWHLQALKDSYAIGPPAITTDTDGNTDGVDIVAPAPFGTLESWTNTSGSWQVEHVTGGLFTPGITGSGTVTRNNGSENIAFFGEGGDLDFYWQGSRGFEKEIVAVAGVN